MHALRVNEQGVALVHIEAVKLMQLLTTDDSTLRSEVATIILQRVQGERSAQSMALASQLLDRASGGLRNLRVAYAAEDSATWWARRNLEPDKPAKFDYLASARTSPPRAFVRPHRHHFAPDISAGARGLNAHATRAARNNAARTIQAHMRGNATRKDLRARGAELERARRVRERERREAEKRAEREARAAARRALPPPEPGAKAERDDYARDVLQMARALERFTWQLNAEREAHRKEVAALKQALASATRGDNKPKLSQKANDTDLFAANSHAEAAQAAAKVERRRREREAAEQAKAEAEAAPLRAARRARWQRAFAFVAAAHRAEVAGRARAERAAKKEAARVSSARRIQAHARRRLAQRVFQPRRALAREMILARAEGRHVAADTAQGEHGAQRMMERRSARRERRRSAGRAPAAAAHQPPPPPPLPQAQEGRRSEEPPTSPASAASTHDSAASAASAQAGAAGRLRASTPPTRVRAAVAAQPGDAPAGSEAGPVSSGGAGSDIGMEDEQSAVKLQATARGRAARRRAAAALDPMDGLNERTPALPLGESSSALSAARDGEEGQLRSLRRGSHADRSTSPTREQERAASRIQASSRGRAARQFASERQSMAMAAHPTEEEERAAVVHIQATSRGRAVRQFARERQSIGLASDDTEDVPGGFKQQTRAAGAGSSLLPSAGSEEANGEETLPTGVARRLWSEPAPAAAT